MSPNLDLSLVTATILLNITTILILAIETHNWNSSEVVDGLILQIFSLICVGDTTMLWKRIPLLAQPWTFGLYYIIVGLAVKQIPNWVNYECAFAGFVGAILSVFQGRQNVYDAYYQYHKEQGNVWLLNELPFGSFYAEQHRSEAANSTGYDQINTKSITSQERQLRSSRNQNCDAPDAIYHGEDFYGNADQFVEIDDDFGGKYASSNGLAEAAGYLSNDAGGSG
ncbi:hypothetical protein I203_101631 [Kwoniella mangroviensis CBS 8507]|uniref:uncharacterized protein n=1 Tax=Kwoniella mangroviensis CBS 8507 TaxID=1296122 RepID=UPI0030665007